MNEVVKIAEEYNVELSEEDLEVSNEKWNNSGEICMGSGRWY